MEMRKFLRTRKLRSPQLRIDSLTVKYSQNMLWYGGYQGSLKNVIVTYPVPELPNLIHLFFTDAPAYTTTIANMEDAVMVTDAPAHQSKLVIQWIKENLKKSPTHLLVSIPLSYFKVDSW